MDTDEDQDAYSSFESIVVVKDDAAAVQENTTQNRQFYYGDDNDKNNLVSEQTSARQNEDASHSREQKAKQTRGEKKVQDDKNRGANEHNRDGKLEKGERSNPDDELVI